jgi:hypothetical protein
MPAPTITPLPAAPSRSTDPATFATEADAFVGALPTFGTQANAQAAYLDALAIAADADAVAAAASAVDAEGFADDAAASAAGAAAAADVDAWVSGTTYTIGVCVFSPIDFQTYRRTTNGAGTTDPSADAVNWVAITGAGGGGSITAVASGALSDGTKVVLNSNGTVSAVSKTITALNPPTAGTTSNAAGFSTPSIIAAAYDKRRKLVFLAANIGTTLSLFVGEVVGNLITFQFNSTSPATMTNATPIGIVYDDITQQVVVAYTGPTGDTFGYALVGTVAYDANVAQWKINFGSQIAFNSSLNTGHIALAINSDNGTILIGYQNSTPILVRAATLGLRTMTLGTAVTVNASATQTGLCYIGNNNFVVAYRIIATGLTAAVVSVSGTTATVNTAINLSGTSSIAPVFCACDIAAQRLVTTYVNSSTGLCLINVASISGTTLTAGGSASISSVGVSNQVGVSFNPDSGRFVFAYINTAASSQLHAVSGLITGTNIALVTGVAASGGITSSTFPVSIFRSDVGDTIVGSIANGPPRCNIVQSATITANLTTDNFVGISDGAYANGANATIQTVGAVDDAQSGLTPGRRYFVGEDGLLKLVPSDWEPVVYAGVATTATSLLIKG